MHRVELKAEDSISEEEINKMFLMHRVELKDRTWEGEISCDRRS